MGLIRELRTSIRGTGCAPVHTAFRPLSGDVEECLLGMPIRGATSQRWWEPARPLVVLQVAAPALTVRRAVPVVDGCSHRSSVDPEAKPRQTPRSIRHLAQPCGFDPNLGGRQFVRPNEAQPRKEVSNECR